MATLQRVNKKGKKEYSEKESRIKASKKKSNRI